MTSFLKIKLLAELVITRWAKIGSVFVAALVLATLSLLSPFSMAQSDTGFDHSTTLFALTGLHEQVRCESCHIKGIFKSTPRDCSGCHVQNNQRGAKAKPVNHIQSSDNCEECHSVTSFTAVRFSHIAVVLGSCAGCHDGRRAQGKSATHFPTTESCDRCHLTSAFLPVPLFDHAANIDNISNCASCHNNVIAKGTPTNHLPRSNTALCGSCHVASTQSNFVSFAGGQMDHTGLTSGCTDCHGANINGGSFYGISNIVAMPPTSPVGPRSHFPTAAACEACHASDTPTGLIPANASKGVPGSDFGKNPQQAKLHVHDGVTGGCSSCHDTNYTWLGMSSYPMVPATFVAKAKYTGFHARPMAIGGANTIADAAHPTTGECADCHSGTTFFAGEAKPDNHIPYKASASCTACHTNADYSVLPSLTSIHANAQSTTTNCVQCHAANVVDGFAIPAANFKIVGPGPTHVPFSATTGCETCHVTAATLSTAIPSLPVKDGNTFKQANFSHTGITTGCAACHGANVVSGTFQGITSIVALPPTSSPGMGSHIPTTAACESCHQGSTPSGLVAGNATKTAPGTAFATPVPTGPQIHQDVSSGCNRCHEAGFVWMGVDRYPISPKTKSTVVDTPYKGFQTRPRAAGSTYSVADATHPVGRDCVECHGSTSAFWRIDKPANHIPYAATAACISCHIGTDFSATPPLANIHANAQSTTTNCEQCHAANVVAGFAIPAINFTIKGPVDKHVPFTTGCEVCHVAPGTGTPSLPVRNGNTFGGSVFSHNGINNGCNACHGPAITDSSFYGITRITVLPPTSPAGPNSHIPTSADCSVCHAHGTVPVPANAVVLTPPGTKWASPVSTNAQIHTGVTGGCNSCHDTNAIWLGMTSNYPMKPAVLTANAQYTGFHSRPTASGNATAVADPSHPATGDCSKCHTRTDYFDAAAVPDNHIPYRTGVTCAACHTDPDFSVWPTLTNIHANAQSTTTNCAQCHAANVVAGFAIPAANNFKIVGPSTTAPIHVPFTTGCETCHVGTGTETPSLPVKDGNTFKKSNFSHTGITTGCVACHGANVGSGSFQGITSIVVLPKTTPADATSHIPTAATCESCHAGTTPSAQVPGNATTTAPGATGFLSPKPTTTQIHANVGTTGCNSCHDTNYNWMGMTSQYPMVPGVLTANAQYQGFHSRPTSAGNATAVADPAHTQSGDCGTCHKRTDYFDASAVPDNHIPYRTGVVCAACHTSPDFSVWPTLTNIHANAQSTTTNCVQCHAANVVAGFAIPTANNFKIVGPSTTAPIHVPFTTGCETCHVGTGTETPSLPVKDGNTFKKSNFSHTGITTGCAACHGANVGSGSFQGITSIVVLPKTTPMGITSHIPTAATCESCHAGTTPSAPVPGNATTTSPGATGFLSPKPDTKQIHANVGTTGCISCHDTNYNWLGMTSQYPMQPGVLTANAQYTGFHSRPVKGGNATAVDDGAHPTTGDCSNSGCHGTNFNYFEGALKPSNHIPYKATAACGACHTSSDFSVWPTLTNIHANAESTTTNCVQCHAANVVNGFAIPAANNFKIVGPGTNHVPFTTGCETCHVGTTALPTAIPSLPVKDTNTFKQANFSHTGITTGCAACHGAGIVSGTFQGITNIVVLPKTSPAGATSHIPTTAACETCHKGETPTALVAGNATKTVPGTGFGTVTVLGTDIHKGVTSCSMCHETGYVWLGVGKYTRNFSTLQSSTATQYTGFNSRPTTAGGPYAIADAAHATGENATGDCFQCHSNSTAYFSAPVKPTGHIPTVQSCSTCHIKAGDYSVQGLATTAVLHTGLTTSSACRTCHAAGPFVGCNSIATCTAGPTTSYTPQPKQMPLAAGANPATPSSTTHVYIGNAECGVNCHTSFTAFSGMNMKSNATAHDQAEKGQPTYGTTGYLACRACHNKGPWSGVSIVTKNHNSGKGCNAPGSDCHVSGKYDKFSSGHMAAVRPVLRSAVIGARPRLVPGLGSVSDLTGATTAGFNHQGVLPGECASCHNGQAAKGLPVKHISTQSSCDVCHRSTAWKPAQFTHQGVPFGQCQICHNGQAGPGKNAGHFVTARSCDACHKVVGWLPVMYSHISPLYQMQPDKTSCVSCHITNGEIIPRQARGGTRPRPTQ